MRPTERPVPPETAGRRAPAAEGCPARRGRAPRGRGPAAGSQMATAARRPETAAPASRAAPAARARRAQLLAPAAPAAAREPSPFVSGSSGTPAPAVTTVARAVTA